MMTWNHRVIKQDSDRVDENWYEIHECFYDNKEDIVPTSWTKNAIAPTGETIEELLTTLGRMIDACRKPVLVIEGNKLIEQK